jgi:hypothetical protein
LTDGQEVVEPLLEVKAVIQGDGMRTWRLEYGEGEDPNRWHLLIEGNAPQPTPVTLAVIDLSQLPASSLTLAPLPGRERRLCGAAVTPAPPPADSHAAPYFHPFPDPDAAPQRDTPDDPLPTETPTHRDTLKSSGEGRSVVIHDFTAKSRLFHHRD